MISIWFQLQKFPIIFHKLDCLERHDETDQITEMLTKLTPQVMDVFDEIQKKQRGEKSPRSLEREVTDFFGTLGPRGILTCLGIRKTLGS